MVRSIENTDSYRASMAWLLAQLASKRSNSTEVNFETMPTTSNAGTPNKSKVGNTLFLLTQIV
jgi:hypothetical protein